MLPFLRFRWTEMRDVARALIAHIHEGHAQGGEFSVPVVDLLRLFAPGASAAELNKIAARGSVRFTIESGTGGSFRLASGERALFDLKRENLFVRVPSRLSGRYAVRDGAFHLDFNAGEELEGCKRFLILICNRILSIDVSAKRLEARAPNPIFNLTVDFE